MSPFTSLLSLSPRLLLLGAVVYAPWAFGTTRPWTIQVLEIVLYAMGALWLAEIIVLRSFTKVSADRPHVPKLLLGLIILLVGYGWTRAANASSYFDAYLLRFEAVPQFVPFWPGTVDAGASRAAMVRISALLLVVVFSANLARDPRWRQRVLITMAATAISIAVFGIAQKIAHAPLLFWEADRFSETTFAMYRYHANAGAFLNLVWPLCGALAWRAFQRKSAFAGRALWLPGFLILLAGLVLNISKGGHLVAGLLGLAIISVGVSLIPRIERASWAKWLVASAVIMAAGAALVMFIGVETVSDRWRELSERELGKEGRFWMALACLDMVREHPWAGFGPGTFSLVVPFYSHPYPELTGVWLHAHCDYLQTLVEWGAGGFLFWATLVVGGLRRLVQRIRGSSAGSWKRSRPDEASPSSGKATARGAISRTGKTFDLAILLSLSGVFVHAAFDFPLQIGSIQLYAAVLLGFAWRSSGSPETDGKLPNQDERSFTLAAP